MRWPTQGHTAGRRFGQSQTLVHWPLRPWLLNVLSEWPCSADLSQTSPPPPVFMHSPLPLSCTSFSATPNGWSSLSPGLALPLPLVLQPSQVFLDSLHIGQMVSSVVPARSLFPRDKGGAGISDPTGSFIVQTALTLVPSPSLPLQAYPHHQWSCLKLDQKVLSLSLSARKHSNYHLHLTIGTITQNTMARSLAKTEKWKCRNSVKSVLLSVNLNWMSPNKGPVPKCNHLWASLMAQMVKKWPVMWETWVRYLGWEDSLEEGMAIYSSIFA